MLCGPPPQPTPVKEYHLYTLICQNINKIMLTLSILVWEFLKRLQLIQARKQTPNCNVKIPQTEAKGIILEQTGYKVNYGQNRQRITKCWFIITTSHECFKQN